MTDRGLPIVDGAPACPFVAFEDDRDERATGPDARHRCYAEVRPAPRAQAHQDAYCLSSGFALCPTFQDWARREGARVSRAASGPPETDEPLRNPKRAWQAPPPWLSATGADPGDPSRRPPQDWIPGANRPGPEEVGLAGSLAHQIAMGGQPRDPAAQEPLGPSAGDPDQARGRGFSAEPGEVADAWQDHDRAPSAPVPAAGLPPQAAYRPDPSAGRQPPESRPGPGDWSAASADPRDPQDDGRPVHVGRTSGFTPAPGRPMVSEPSSRRRTGESVAPPWERPRRYEAYPTLRTRMGMPAPSRTVMIFLALVLAAVGLFFLPTLLGFNSPAGTPSPAPSATPSPLPTVLATPTIDPGPTPQVYIIRPGDTMSRIASQFGIPLNELIEANKEVYPDPNKIQVGDELIIPVPQPTTFPDAGTPEPSAAP